MEVFKISKDRVIYKDFGKSTTDKESRDESLKAYICSILDVPAIEFDDIIKSFKGEKEKEAFIRMIYYDMKGRVESFLNERN